MTPKQIAKARKLREDKIAKLRTEIKHIQDTCPHAHLIYEARGSTGSWDREDSFWYTWRCLDCEHSWTTEQSGHYEETRRARKVEDIRAKTLKFENTRDPWNDL